METTQTERPRRRERSRETDKSEGSIAKDVGRQAVYKEGDVKENMGPSVSMTTVGNDVTFTQHFHF